MPSAIFIVNQKHFFVIFQIELRQKDQNRSEKRDVTSKTQLFSVYSIFDKLLMRNQQTTTKNLNKFCRRNFAFPFFI